MGKMKKRIAVLGTVTALAIGGGFAWAAWTSNGNGSASAQAGSAAGLEVAATGGDAPKVVGDLVPNGSAADLQLKIVNKNKYQVKLTKLTLVNIVVSPSPGSETGCTSSTNSTTAALTATNAGKSGIVLAGGAYEYSLSALTPAIILPAATNAAGTTTPVTLTGAVKMTNASDNDCQGDGFALKPGDSVGITAEFIGKNLDRDVALQLRVASSVDIAHPARTQVRLQLVGSEMLSNELAGLRSADFATVRGRRWRRQKTSRAIMRPQ